MLTLRQRFAMLLITASNLSISSLVYGATGKEHVTAGIMLHCRTISLCLGEAKDRTSILPLSLSGLMTPATWCRQLRVIVIGRGICRACRGVHMGLGHHIRCCAVESESV